MPSRWNLSFLIARLLLLALAAWAGFAAAQPAATADALRSGVRDWVATQSGVAPDLVEVAPLDARVRIPGCAAGYAHDYPFASRDTVRVRCEAAAWQLYVRVTVNRPQPLVVATRALPAGRVLAEDDLVVKPVGRSARDGFDNRNLVVGRVVRNPIAAGAPVLAADLEEGQTIVRLTAPVKSGMPLAGEAVKLESVPRNRVPPGAVLGLAALEEARAARDLPAGHLLLVADVNYQRQVMVAKKALAAGQLVEPALFELAPHATRETTAQFVSDLKGHEYSELARTLKPGEALRATDLRPALLVKRGEPVTLTVRTSGGLEITLRAEALQDGRYGERVNLKNPESGRTLTGIVTGRNTARGV